jgi:flagellar motility protein MotE (MotC chaperone)
MTKAATGEFIEFTEVPFEKLFLDPNNPRIAPENPPGYNAPSAIFDADMQKALETRIRAVYPVDDLESSIMAQGWVPYDPIVVWEHPQQPKHYIVVEGNTRTTALRTLRGERLDRERKKLEKLQASPGRFEEERKVQEELVAHLELVVTQTNNIRVYPMKADTVEELVKKLPQMMGVRHITHAQQWSPYATNLYILSLYEQLFRERHGPKPKLRIEEDLVEDVGERVSYGAAKKTKTRRAIQAASAFTHFKRDFEERLPEDEEFTDRDHYFFEQILQSKFAQDQFEFTKDSLRLPAESEEALFKWAFSLPRSGGGDEANPNIFYKAENIGLWSKMKSYDGKKSTNFAANFDVAEPDKAPSMRTIEADYLQHQTRSTPIDAVTALLKALREIKVDALVSQQEHLGPMLDEVGKLVEKYKKMMDAAQA